MSTIATSRAVLVSNGQYGLVHLTNAITETEYKIQYALSDTLDNQRQFWADIMRDGAPLTLTPENTPLLLNVPGAYRFIENSPTVGTIRTATYPLAGFTKGAIA